ncbi:XdhC family protein [Fusobacterium perfoetens]|uniref:XdhC family protein n=1 Tax=Fusobacterium perfoetens TaxID=852 RepID=UPI000686E1A1|nr:XdhC family protein [Fusobacterium perfoetens]
MTEIDILKNLYDNVKKGEKCALVTLVESFGATPRKSGAIMGVTKDKTIGTIGGGMAEYKAIELSRECIEKGENKIFDFDLTQDGKNTIGMTCGGRIKGFIKFLKPSERIIIVGAGHVGKKLYGLLKESSFETVILDDREDSENIENIIVGDFENLLENLPENSESYYVVVTKGHKSDLIAVKKILKKQFRYLGVIGSRKKVQEMRDNLIKDGYEIPEDRFFSPIGLNLSDGTPYEIAVDILSEILSVKNEKEKIIHMKDR